MTGRKEREREEVGVGPRCSSRIVNRAGTEGYIVSRLAGKTVLLVVGQSEGEGSTSSISDKSHGGPFVPTVPGLEPRVFHQVFPAINVRPPSDRSFSTAADSSRRRHAEGGRGRGDGGILTHANSDDFVPRTLHEHAAFSTIASAPSRSLRLSPPLPRLFLSRTKFNLVGRRDNGGNNNERTRQLFFKVFLGY